MSDLRELESDSSQVNISNDRDKLRNIAIAQRRVLLAVLANVAANVLVFSTSGQAPPIPFFALLVSLGVLVVTIIALFRLVKQIGNTVGAVLCCIMMPVPFLSLLVLLIVNQKATDYLKVRGIKVGLMGADLSRI